MAKAEKLVVPELGESISEAVVGKWLVSVGDTVAADEPVVDLETDKITMQIPAPVAGALTEQNFSEGDTVQVGDIVGAIDPAFASSKTSQPQTSITPSQNSSGMTGANAASPTAVSNVSATKQVVTTKAADTVDESLLRNLTPAQRREARITGHMPKTPETMGEGVLTTAAITQKPVGKLTAANTEVVPMSSLRKRIAERLVQAQHESASLTTFNEVNMQPIMNLRSEYKKQFLDKHGVKLGFMSFFVKACMAAAKDFPGVNAEIVDKSIHYKKHYDFGIAVSTPKGLVVPVLRGVDALSFADIEMGIVTLATRAREGKLTLDDLVGGTFTITNGGIYGSMMSTPLLNYPQTGILGMHNIVQRPMAVDDTVVVLPMMNIALTYDHRVVDGREAVSFLVAVKQRLEAPEKLILDI